MKPDYFFFARNIESGEVECFATKYLPASNTRGGRFKFWKTNAALEQRETPVIIGWNYTGSNQFEQLQLALDGWTVLALHEICNRLSYASNTVQP